MMTRGPRQQDVDTVTRLHASLIFHGNIGEEYPEQLMIAKHLEPDDCVLELGGACGRASCIINSLLNDPSKHVVVEPSIQAIRDLAKNRDANRFAYSIEGNAISDVPLYMCDTYTFPEYFPRSMMIETITWDEFHMKYPWQFTFIMADCEGNLPLMIRSFPQMLDTIRCIILEHDFNSMDDLEYFMKTMHQHTFECIDTYRKDDPLGPGIDWTDGPPDDPIFVSVWKRKNVA